MTESIIRRCERCDKKLTRKGRHEKASRCHAGAKYSRGVRSNPQSITTSMDFQEALNRIKAARHLRENEERQ